MIPTAPIAASNNPFSAVLGFVQAQSQAALCAAINHLLTLEPELQTLLTHHSNGTAQLRWPPKAFLPAGILSVRVTQDCLFVPCELTVPADVVITVLDGFMSAPKEQKLRFLRVEGDAMLAQTLALLAQRLHWDVEHDLARWIGDANAGFVSRHARAFAADVQGAAKNLEAAVLTQASATGIDVEGLKQQMESLIQRAKSHLDEKMCANSGGSAAGAGV